MFTQRFRPVRVAPHDCDKLGSILYVRFALSSNLVCCAKCLMEGARDRPQYRAPDLRVAQTRLRELVLASKRTNSVSRCYRKGALKQLTQEIK